jgi:hypothetical protein
MTKRRQDPDILVRRRDDDVDPLTGHHVGERRRRVALMQRRDQITAVGGGRPQREGIVMTAHEDDRDVPGAQASHEIVAGPASSAQHEHASPRHRW